jgi:hypothetical protein
MGELNEQHRDAIDKMNDLFIGDPKKVLIQVEKPQGNLLS